MNQLTFSENYTIRPATNADSQVIQQIVSTVLAEYSLPFKPESKDSDLADIRRCYFDNGGFFGVLVDSADGNIVGSFGLYRSSAESAELRKMYLVQEVRGRGCGRLMLEYAIQAAREMGCRKVCLETLDVLKEAVFLYRKFGFIEVPVKEVNDRVDRAFELEL